MFTRTSGVRLPPTRAANKLLRQPFTLSQYVWPNLPDAVGLDCLPHKLKSPIPYSALGTPTTEAPIFVRQSGQHTQFRVASNTVSYTEVDQTGVLGDGLANQGVCTDNRPDDNDRPDDFANKLHGNMSVENNYLLATEVRDLWYIQGDLHLDSLILRGIHNFSDDHGGTVQVQMGCHEVNNDDDTDEHADNDGSAIPAKSTEKTAHADIIEDFPKKVYHVITSISGTTKLRGPFDPIGVATLGLSLRSSLHPWALSTLLSLKPSGLGLKASHWKGEIGDIYSFFLFQTPSFCFPASTT